MFGLMNCSVSQINIPAVLVANGLGASLMLVILVCKRKQIQKTYNDSRFFYWMCLICFTLCLLETAGFILDGKVFPGARQISLIFNAIILMLSVVIAYLWVCFVDYKLFSDTHRFQTFYPIMAIPAALICLMSLANLFVDVFFSISDRNIYYRTPLFIFPWAVVYGYMTFGAFLFHHYRKRVDKYLFLPVIVFLIPVYLGSIIQLFYYGISVIWPSVALGLTFLYMNLQSEEAYLDPLTNLYNRSYLLHYIQHISKQAKKGRHVIGIMMDVDGFKQINDNCGHSKGDTVLQAVGKVLLRATRDTAVVIRYGGDEFVILLEKTNPHQVQSVLDNIHRELERYNSQNSVYAPVSLSMGIAEFDCKDVFGFFQEMDKKMYNEKRALYSRRAVDEALTSRGEG